MQRTIIYEVIFYLLSHSLLRFDGAKISAFNVNFKNIFNITFNRNATLNCI